MIHQLRMTWAVAVLLAAALLAATAMAVTADPVARADDDDPAGVCIHVRRLDPTHEYCVWLTRAT